MFVIDCVWCEGVCGECMYCGVCVSEDGTRKIFFGTRRRGFRETCEGELLCCCVVVMGF